MSRSLLSYSKADNQFNHFNSLPGTNKQAAHAVARAAGRLLGIQYARPFHLQIAYACISYLACANLFVIMINATDACNLI